MAELKTKVNNASVTAFISKVKDKAQQADAKQVSGDEEKISRYMTLA